MTLSQTQSRARESKSTQAAAKTIMRGSRGACWALPLVACYSYVLSCRGGAVIGKSELSSLGRRKVWTLGCQAFLMVQSEIRVSINPGLFALYSKIAPKEAFWNASSSLAANFLLSTDSAEW